MFEFVCVSKQADAYVFKIFFWRVFGGVLLCFALIYMHAHPIPITGGAAEAIEQMGWEPIMPFSLDPSIFISQGEIVLILAILAISYPIWIISNFKVIRSLRG